MSRISQYRSRFTFRFGQRVRVRRPQAESGATGQVIAGQLYPDGTELYAVDVPGGSWRYDVHDLEDADDLSGR